MHTEAGVQTDTPLPTPRPDGPSLELGPEEEAFFKSETGIQDTEELREHILKVQEDAYKAGHFLALIQYTCTKCQYGVSYSGLPVPLHSWVWIREAQDRHDARISACPRIREKPAGRDISGHRMLQ